MQISLKSYVVRSAGQMLFVAAVIISNRATANDSPTEEAFEGFDTWVESVMSDWKVPGLAVAAVRDGKVVLANGYGYRNVKEKHPVTKDTLFAIGSNGKSFTVTLLGMLNDDGVLDWDRPVRDYLPGFQLHDAVATVEMTPRDLVTHRSGLPRHDLVWFATGRTRRELVDGVRYLQPSKKFRSTYQYQNIMFVTAGYLAGQITGSTWEAQVSGRIMKPIGMQRSNFSVDDMQDDSDFAFPYGDSDDKVVQIPFRNLDAIGPAGSINSSVSEMIRYVQFHIDYGKCGENRLLSERNAIQMQTPQMVIPAPENLEDRDVELGDSTYGLGLDVSSYRGHKQVGHGGAIDGFISAMAWLPNDRIGAVVLTNLSGRPNPVPNIVVRNVFDRLLSLDPIDWNDRTLKRVNEQLKKQEEAKKKAASEQKKGTSPSHSLADYTGEYKHVAYGRASVRLEDGSLHLAVVGFDLPLAHFHYDVFTVPEDVPRQIDVFDVFSGRRVQFFYNKKGEIDRVAMMLDPQLDDIVFERVKEQDGD